MVVHETRLALVSNREDKDDVVGALEAVERDIAAVATRDHQLSQFALCRPPDQGMLGEYRHRAGDQFDRGSCAGSVGGQQEVKEPIEVGEGTLGIDQPRRRR